MTRSLALTIMLLTAASWAFAQNPPDSVYLLRQPDNRQDFIRIPSSSAYFVRKAGLKPGHFGWQLPDGFVPSEGNLLYFDMDPGDVPAGPWSDYTGGSFQLIIDLPPGIAELNLDTLSRLDYHFINNYASRGLKDADDHLSGILQFQYQPDSSVVISGTIDIITSKPYTTRQQVVYHDAAFPLMSLVQHDNIEAERKTRQILAQQAEEAREAAIAREKQAFFDSLFTKKMAKRCSLSGSWDSRQKFTYRLSESYILTGAILGREPEGSLMDMLGHNFLEVSPGTSMVILLHSLDDPDPRVIDDETNYSLGIQVDSLLPGKTAFFHTSDAAPGAILGYWHWGPGGHAVFSEKVEGTVTVWGNTGGLVSGKLDLTFYIDKRSIRIAGTYLLRLVPVTAVSGIDERLRQKYGQQAGQ